MRVEMKSWILQWRTECRGPGTLELREEIVHMLQLVILLFGIVQRGLFLYNVGRKTCPSILTQIIPKLGLKTADILSFKK